MAGPAISAASTRTSTSRAKLAGGLRPLQPFGDPARRHRGRRAARHSLRPSLAEQPGHRRQRRGSADLFDRPANHRREVGGEVAGVGDHVVALGAEHRLRDQLGLRAPAPVDRGSRGAGTLGDRGEAQLVVAPLLQQRDRRIDDRRRETNVPGSPSSPPFVRPHYEAVRMRIALPGVKLAGDGGGPRPRPTRRGRGDVVNNPTTSPLPLLYPQPPTRPACGAVRCRCRPFRPRLRAGRTRA